MMGKMDEMIMVVDRSLLESMGYFNGLDFDRCETLLASLGHSNCRFMPRGEAEENEAFKQLIPYVIITHGDRILYYVRGKKSGEGRLKAKGSIGIGGHINDEDGSLAATESILSAYVNAMVREIGEEVNIPGGYTHSTVCLLNDDSNSVGRVHLGVVHRVVTNDDNVTFAEPDIITEVAWRTPGELAAVDIMESWSSICLSGIGRILGDSVTKRIGGTVNCKRMIQ